MSERLNRIAKEAPPSAQHKGCSSCKYNDVAIGDYPCRSCALSPCGSERDFWLPSGHSEALLELGRRAGIEEAIADLSARSKELFGVYDTTKIDRRCDIYEIRHGEAEHCVGLVKALLEAK